MERRWPLGSLGRALQAPTVLEALSFCVRLLNVTVAHGPIFLFDGHDLAFIEGCQRVT